MTAFTSTNIGVRIRTMLFLFSAVDSDGLICVFEFGQLRRPSANTARPVLADLFFFCWLEGFPRWSAGWK